MPIPFLLGAAAAVVVAGKGVLDHVEASDTNDTAQWIQKKAQELFDEEKEKLEAIQKKTEESLLNLGNSKKNVLENSMSQFLRSYDRVKNIEFNKTDAINEISNYVIDEQDAVEMQELTANFISTFSSGVAGAATGSIIALAATGSIGILTGGLTFAGTLVSVGMPGLALSMAGSTIAGALAATPLAALAAPAVLFSGLAAKGKADENYDKAKEYEAEVEKAVEQMKTSSTICEAVSERANMFADLLTKLNIMFADCSRRLDDMTAQKVIDAKGRELNISDFDDNDIKLLAITRALAGAVKSILDTPILSKEGNITDESEAKGKELKQGLPDFESAYSKIS